jgi:ribonuclease VapC
MIVDASAIVAIMLDEPEGRALAARIEAAEVRLTHPISMFEAAQAVARQWRRALPDVQQDLREFLALADIDVVEIGSAEAKAAIEASARYGKGRHPAALNLGDCFSYACARLRSMPLLYKGDDFSRTDLA